MPAPTFKVFHNYKDVASSFEKSQALLGILQPGRYRGFDTKTTWPGSTPGYIHIAITHSATGITQVDTAGSFTSPMGIALMPQGTVIQTADAHPALIADNSANAHERLDYICIEHQWTPVIGGTSPTIVVVTGPTGGPVLPAIPNPAIQIPIGVVSVAASGSTYADLTYTAVDTPQFANVTPDIIALYGSVLNALYARLASNNTMIGHNTFQGDVTMPFDGGIFYRYNLMQEKFSSLDYSSINASGLLEVEPEHGNHIELDLGNQNKTLRGVCFVGGTYPNPGTRYTIRILNPGSTAGIGIANLPTRPGFLSNYRTGYFSNGDVIEVRYYTFLTQAVYELLAWPQIMERNYQDIILKANAAQPSWNSLTYENGFETAVGLAVQYRKNTLGQIEVRGFFKHASTTPLLDTLIGTLPVGYRPDRTYVLEGIYALAPNKVIITIGTDGTIKCTDVGTGYAPGAGIGFHANTQLTSA